MKPKNLAEFKRLIPECSHGECYYHDFCGGYLPTDHNLYGKRKIKAQSNGFWLGKSWFPWPKADEVEFQDSLIAGQPRENSFTMKTRLKATDNNFMCHEFYLKNGET